MLRIAGQPHRAGNNCRWKVRDRRRKLPDCTRRPFGVFRRGLRTPAVRKHVSGADGIHFWLAPTVKPEVCDFFSFFSCSYKKRTRFSFAKEKICAFLTEEKSTKRLTETLSRTLMLLLGSVYPRLEDVAVLAELAQATTHRAESNGGLGSPRPQAQGARRVSASRGDVHKHGGG